MDLSSWCVRVHLETSVATLRHGVCLEGLKKNVEVDLPTWQWRGSVRRTIQHPTPHVCILTGIPLLSGSCRLVADHARWKENKTQFRAAAVLDPHQEGLHSFSIILSQSSSSVLGTLSGWISRSRCTFGLRVNNCGSGLPFSWRLLGLRHSLDCLLLRSDPAERL